jgi:predicted O-methyltransferase YrrM
MVQVLALRKNGRKGSKATRVNPAAQHQNDAYPFASPPEWVKQRYLLDWIQHTGHRTFVETGTYVGGTARALAARCRKVFTVELDEDLFHRARRRLADLSQVEVILGSSLEVIPTILERLEEPALFWLAAHAKPCTPEYRRQIPLLREVELILNHRHAAGHVVLIDDARFFTGTGAYPSLKQIAKTVAQISDHKLHVYNDAIHLYGGEC